jgi:formylglycine-generating enzyme required for sulfatase activity
LAHDAFISYSQLDKIAADAVCHRMEAAGVRCWIAPRDIAHGKTWDDAVVDGITAAKLLVVIFPAAANASPHVLNEVATALDARLTVIPFRIEDIRPTGALRLHLGRVHWLDALTPPLEEHIDRLIESAKRNLPAPLEDEGVVRQAQAEERHRQRDEEAPRRPQEEQRRRQKEEQRKEPERRPEEERRAQEAAQRRPKTGDESGGHREGQQIPARAGPRRRRRTFGILAVVAACVVGLGMALIISGVFKPPPPAKPQNPFADAPPPVKPQNPFADAPPPAPPSVAPQPPPALAAPGQSFRDCPDCPEMVVVPPGQFMMGSDPSDKDSYGDERPRHTVTLKNAFAVGQYHVMRAEYAKYVQAGGRAPLVDCPIFAQTERDPVVCVSWDDAKAYAAWLSKKTGKSYRLLTEAEWEYAARAGTTTAWYWGDAVGLGNANCDGCGSRWDDNSTSPAGSFKPNSFRLYDMAGNAWQWVEDCYVDYRNAPTDGSAAEAKDCGRRVVRGGSWPDYPRGVRAAHRDGVNRPVNRYGFIGFRVARTITP